MREDVLVEIYRAENAPQAHMVCEQLGAAGIPARVDGDYLQGALGGLPLGWSSSCRVLIADSDVAAAKKVLNALPRSL